MTYELCTYDWSDYGDTVHLHATCVASSPVDAANKFRSYGFSGGYINETGSCICKSMEDL